MSGRPNSSDDAAELKKLFEELPDTIGRASKALKELDVLHGRYIEEDDKAARILARIDELTNH
jgi:hypothetical protein